MLSSLGKYFAGEMQGQMALEGVSQDWYKYTRGGRRFGQPRAWQGGSNADATAT